MITQRQKELLIEAGISVPEGADNFDFVTIEDEDKLIDHMMNVMDVGLEPTPKSEEIADLLSAMADRNNPF